MIEKGGEGATTNQKNTSLHMWPPATAIQRACVFFQPKDDNDFIHHKAEEAKGETAPSSPNTRIVHYGCFQVILFNCITPMLNLDLTSTVTRRAFRARSIESRRSSTVPIAVQNAAESAKFSFLFCALIVTPSCLWEPVRPASRRGRC